MSDTNWELKDRRIAWMNINTSCSVIQAARINAGLYKPATREEAMHDLLQSIDIVYASFLNDCGRSNPITSQTTKDSNQGEEPAEGKTLFKNVLAFSPQPSTTSPASSAGIPPASPQKKVKKKEDGKWFCFNCSKEVTSSKVKDYSMDHWGKILCYDCQNKEG